MALAVVNARSQFRLWNIGADGGNEVMMDDTIPRFSRGLVRVPESFTAEAKSVGRRKEEAFPPAESSGYKIRDANRAFQRLLERRIAPFKVSRGQWYFLRVLWTEDGLSQSELSARVGTMEPTTTVGLRRMEQAGLVRRVRSQEDKRKTHVWLTPKAKRLRQRLLPIARGITEEAAVGIDPADLAVFMKVVIQMTKNLDQLED